MKNNQGNISIIIGFGVLSLMLIAAAFFLPWKNVDWGTIRWTPAQVVSVTGEARSQQRNQIATYNAGVNAVKDKKEDAVKEVNDKIKAVVDAVKGFGIEPADIKTQNMSIYQEEDSYYEGSVRKSRPGQWRVNNSIEITLRDIEKAAGLTDLLTNSGANNVYGPNFSFDDTSKMEKELFDAAMKDAREKAELIAKAAGRKLGKVINANEGSGTVDYLPLRNNKEMGGMGGGSVIESGSGNVSKSLSVTFVLE